jgi:FkbM family methyltransferase
LFAPTPLERVLRLMYLARRLSKRDLAAGRRVLRVGACLMEVPAERAWAFPGGAYYERNIDYWFERLLGETRPAVVYDVGANIGYYALRAAQAGAQHVYAFEPASATFDVLKRNLSRNRLGSATALRYAVSDTVGEGRLTLYDSSGINTLTPRQESEPYAGVTGTESVEVVTLDMLVGERGLMPPSVLKIDVEGSELAVLRGARVLLEQARPHVIVEYNYDAAHELGYDFEDLSSELRRTQLQVFALVHPLRGDPSDTTLYAPAALPPQRVGALVAIEPRNV